jgi:hypothetical protein
VLRILDERVAADRDDERPIVHVDLLGLRPSSGP